jgi:hypothetical protein
MPSVNFPLCLSVPPELVFNQGKRRKTHRLGEARHERRGVGARGRAGARY